MNLHSLNEIDDALRSGGLSVRDLYGIWDQRLAVADSQHRPGEIPTNRRQFPWLQEDVSIPRRFIQCAIEKEEFLLACDAARETLRYWSGGDDEARRAVVRVRMDYANALTRLGATHDARCELEPCSGDDFRPQLGRKLKADILIQLGNILREDSQNSTSRAAMLKTAHQALQFYERALQLEPHRLDALVLSAVAALMLGEPGSALRDQASSSAHLILKRTKELDETEGLRWQTVRTRAVAHAVLGEIDAAVNNYGMLSEMPGVTTEILAGVRHDARFVAEAAGKPRDFFKAAFPPLQLGVFVGHLPDQPGRPPRFTPELIEPMREKIRQRLKELNVQVGLVCAAAGADLLFTDAMRERGGAIHLVLPWPREEFRKTSVRQYELPGAPPFWEPLFDQALSHAETIREIGHTYEPGTDVGWNYAMEVTAGLALHTAHVKWLDLQPIVLWDGRPGWGIGGTASFVDFCRRRLHKEPIWLELPSGTEAERGTTDAGWSRRSEQPTLHQEVKTMMFADIVGYSKLTEHVIPEFVETFLGRVSQLVARSAHAPSSVETWGDAIYAVFDFVRDGGLFALELTEMIRDGAKDWQQKGLYWEEPQGDGLEPRKHPLSIRIGLHTGPVFMHYSPVVRKLGFTGAHATRAARIEPVANPGEVFASEEFAALAELDRQVGAATVGANAEEQDTGFVCEYAGSMQLAKNYPGRHRIYRVLPKRVLALEELAKAAHDSYCAEARARGETAATNSSLQPWDQLPDDLREANRALVADIPNKLRELGYELSPSHGLGASEITMTASQIEALSIREHDRWVRDRERHGWSYAPQRDSSRKQHPLMVPWDQLSESAKDKDRDAVRNLPRLIEKAGFRVRKIS